MYHQPKIKIQNKNPRYCNLYYPHTHNNIQIKPYFQIGSIDPAIKNCAFRIERRYPDSKIEPILFQKISVLNILEYSEHIEIDHTYQVLNNFLDLNFELFNQCDIIIIERQMPYNYDAVRVSQHIISYFSIRLKNNESLTKIYEIDSKIKSRYLKAPKGSDVKKWSIETASKFLTDRNDIISLEILKSNKSKMDDLCDTVCQIEAFLIFLDSLKK